MNKMNYDGIKKIFEDRIFPIQLLLCIADFGIFVLKLFKLIESILSFWVIFAITIIQFLIIIFYYKSSKKNKSLIKLYEVLANETLSFAVKFILNQKDLISNTKIERVDLYIEVVNIPQQLDDIRIKEERYDLKYIWTLKGKNTLKKDLDKVYFQIGCDNAVEFALLNFSAFHCKNKKHKKCISNVDTDCSGCIDYKLTINNREIKNKGNTIFTLPLEFNEAIRAGEKFTIKVNYIWPKCYNALLDYIIIDPKAFSNYLSKFTLTIKNDKKIITESTHIRLNWYARSPTEKSKLTGIRNLRYDNEENAFKSGTISTENTKLYIFELQGIFDR